MFSPTDTPAPAPTRSLDEAFAELGRAAEDSQNYAREWKERHDGRKVVGTLPMNFPAELIHASGALPVIVQESREEITAGRNLLFEFYCGYTRSLADQAAKHQFEAFDAFALSDMCIQLQGATDAMQTKLPDKPVQIGQFIASLDESWNKQQVAEQITLHTGMIEELTGETVTPEGLSQSIRAFNRNRTLLREIYALRRTGRTPITATRMQMLIKSSMVMDKAEHTAVLEEILPQLTGDVETDGKVRLHLSGHFCHAPRTELLDLIEECGAVVVDDDLYTGYRYISTDMSEDGDPFAALTGWYLERNVNVPCPTRAQMDVDWDTYLIDSLRESGAAGVIVLMAKFCEPHMLYYPALRKALEEHEIPFLLIETEHEGLPAESIRTRVETMLERIRRGAAPTTVPA
jgi:benzoyl-CoA reductase subunit C